MNSELELGKKKYVVIGFVTAMLAILIFFLVTIKFSVDEKAGYAGDPIDIKDGVVYTPLYRDPWFRSQDEVTVSEGVHIQDENGMWTALGHNPEPGDLIKITEYRLFWRSHIGLIHGWGYTKLISKGKIYNSEWEAMIAAIILEDPSMSIITDPMPSHTEGNPFRIYQRVYPRSDFYTTNPSSELLKQLSQGVVVINIHRDYIRIRLADGNEYTYGHGWFVGVPGDRNTDISEPYMANRWKVGNQFKFGDIVCAVPDSVRESFPDKSIVLGTEGELLYIFGYSGPINHGHFQKCVK